MAHDEGKVCRCVAEHRPPVLEGTDHHVLPIYLGARQDSETVYVCPTTHYSVHELLRQMLKVGHAMTYRECQVWSPRPVARYAHGLAAEAYRRHTDRQTDLT